MYAMVMIITDINKAACFISPHFIFVAVLEGTVKAAINEFHEKTCLKFVPHTNEKNWIRFVRKSG
jgi:hypothetical protein